MGIELDYKNYKNLIDEDIKYILKQPRSLEREHIIEVLKATLAFLYPKSHLDNKALNLT